MFANLYSNLFKALEIPQDPTDYDDFEDTKPYNLLLDGKWTSLWMNRHPLYYKIRQRFDGNYDGKLLSSELNKMKEKIKEKNKEFTEYMDQIYERRSELRSAYIEQKRLCAEDTRESTINTIILSAATASTAETHPHTPLGSFFSEVPEAMTMLPGIISFLPIETCSQKLQKHLDTCTGFNGTYKCSANFVSYDCKFKENGRCSHYYEIEEIKKELEECEYYEEEYRDDIHKLEYYYSRALAVKENRLQEYLDDMYDY
jgi:hypothetical protein